ncbi:hypothetical protein GCU56_01885 [Geodermatophilus sabuli]|uniref:Uncharacterized protein n=1 Tax=Geodermatophilus sabuli TaxID=1564158 RepID=A0A7K3VXN7_9ACTN|nr:hypothetical protein [Geodermatophilus sabuli]NEK56624.1 hypothetical protein [Geodermatophilus sabuli]
MPSCEVDRPGVRGARELIDAGRVDVDTEKRHAFPFGDLRPVDRAALVHAEQRAAQDDHREIGEVADDLLGRLDARQG